MSDRYPGVMRLQVHLPGLQTVYYSDPAGVRRRHELGELGTTTLTEYFRLVREDAFVTGAVRASHVLYKDVSKYWRLVGKKLVPRKSRIPSVARLDSAKITEGEQFYLRLLLNHCIAPSFEALRSFNDTIYSTFREAAFARGLLHDDAHISETLDEARVTASGAQLRELFSEILAFNPPAQPLLLWNKFLTFFCDDCDYLLRQQASSTMIPTQIQNEMYALYLLSKELHGIGITMEETALPIPDHRIFEEFVSLKDAEDRIANESLLHSINVFKKQASLLNDDQRHIFNAIKSKKENNVQSMVFLDGPGGTGKTFLLNTIIHYFRSEGLNTIAVASSGVASLLLYEGSTAHSGFNIPLSCSATSTCNFSGRDKKSKMLIGVDLIIWDEVSMQNKSCIECFERSIKLLRKNNSPFGGISIIFSGDFRQTFPIVPHGTISDQFQACLKTSYI